MDKFFVDLAKNVQHALAEDIGSGDINVELLANNTITAQLISRESAILCGTAWFEETFNQLNNKVEFNWLVKDGDNLAPGQCLCMITSTAQTLLTGERTAINFLQLLSGTATETKRYIEAIANTKTKILDTRKTIPGLRRAQKYAVYCGGGNNHRMGLYDAFLLKENHIAAAGSITQAILAARNYAPNLPIEVEVETLEQVQEALDAKAERLLLDNFTLSKLNEAVNIVQGQVELEASGGITLKNIYAIAKTGVDFISVGTITKNIQAIDFSMRVI
ncbi:carboxylating nicotinate-nucleotide diphosphorylase [Candidatus Halobeggiatoa sp. HSG11]|nr:carboxylating nicotinate-nucleotide diphosphorylase [Candidatus Halobeggiatoa sp. HSG11]